MIPRAEFLRSRELFVNFVLRELRSRYKKSILGWTWSLVNPLATVLVYSVVFSVFLKIEPPTGNPSGLKSFVLFLMCALLPWTFFSNGLSTSVETLVGNAGLIKKVYFPRQLLVAAAVGALLVSMLIELGVLSVILLGFGNMVLPWIPMVLVLVLLEAIFIFGLGLVFAACNVYLRDVRHFVGIALQVLFYSAPIVYPLRLVPETKVLLGVSIPVDFLYRLNPLVQFFEAYRDVLYHLRFPTVGTLLYLVAWTVGALAFGLWVFAKLDRRLAEEV